MKREDILLEYIKDKKVLDIGSVGQTSEYCLWDFLAENCKQLTGVDLPSSIEDLDKGRIIKGDGFTHCDDKRIVYGNMENIDLGEKFEVVVAGDVLEHVSNQGLFLDNISEHLEDNGLLVITTPNAKWPTVFLKPNQTHTLWHDAFTLSSLLNRHNFEIVRLKYYFGNKPHYNLLLKLLAFRQSMFVVAKKSFQPAG